MNAVDEVIITISVCLVVYFNLIFIEEKLKGLPFKKRVEPMLYFNIVPIVVIAGFAMYYVVEFIFP